MNVGRLALVLGAVLLLRASALLAADLPDCKTRPAWCVTGYDCMPTGCLARMTAALRLLTAEAEATQVSAQRFGFCAGVGLGLTAAPYDRNPGPGLDLGVAWNVGPVAAVTWGWRFGQFHRTKPSP